MKVATVLFTYNRSWHTQQVLEGLSKSSVLPEKLYIFHDGLKRGHDENKWKEVRELIHKVCFCPIEIIESEANKGLAESIVDGINYVLKDNDAVIVLEDDCVPAPDFVNFMLQVFHKYQYEQSVYSASGYAWHIDVKSEQYDAYFNGRMSSWGWGTWKDRWQHYSQDNHILERIMTEKKKSIELAAWAKDYPMMLYDRIKGNNNSWAVYWGLKIIENNGLCICPYKTLIKNIGFDGSGVHCGGNDTYQDKLDATVRELYRLPDEKVIEDDVYNKFKGDLGSCLVHSNRENIGENVIIYGMGHFFCQYENDIAFQYNIVAFCDRERKGFYAGIEIIDISRIADFAGCKVIIMIRDMQVASAISNELQNKYCIAADQIVFGTDLFK